MKSSTSIKGQHAHKERICTYYYGFNDDLLAFVRRAKELGIDDEMPPVDLSCAPETLDDVEFEERETAVRWWAKRNMQRLTTVPWDRGNWADVYDHFAPEKGHKARISAYILAVAKVPIDTPLNITHPQYSGQLPDKIDLEKVDKFFGPVDWYLKFEDAEKYGPLKDVPRSGQRDRREPSEQVAEVPLDSSSLD
ncbi:hypothetical protein C8Q78DRAFT_1077649 [Trametes maxima]|nr:hypothetical protein C8Q78DRAFT_1077649 [Trametes maxima]